MVWYPSLGNFGIRIAENRSIRVRHRCGSVRGEAIGNGLRGGVVAGINAELDDKYPHV